MVAYYLPEGAVGLNVRSPRLRQCLVLFATLTVVAVTARMGMWQLDRAAQKQASQVALDSRIDLNDLPQSQLAATAQAADQQHYRRVRLRGTWLAERTVYLDNRQMGGRPGYLVVTPLLVPGGSVLVQRGWVPRDPEQRTRLPPLLTPSGEVELLGRIAPPPARLYEFVQATTGPIRQNIDINAFAGEIKVPLRPLTVLQIEVPTGSGDGLLRQWPQPAFGVHKHYGYAFQWWALCLLTAGLYVWYQLLRPWLRRDAPSP